ncbi:hypothetical protein LBMAG56_41410 [Verrucomicrobiota bacterium]|nr:hypothetical protein LBMAG56_41410 [Verrucomicrobiota bacterium]
MKLPFPAATCTAALLFTACATTPGPNTERGPAGTVAYYVKIESSEPGARVEVNSEFVGTTPLDVRVWGDRDGTFHNFGSSDFIIRVLPAREGQAAQTKTFRTGGWFSQEDQIPKRIFFDLNQKSQGGFTVDPPKPRY